MPNSVKAMVKNISAEKYSLFELFFFQQIRFETFFKKRGGNLQLVVVKGFRIVIPFI